MYLQDRMKKHGFDVNRRAKNQVEKVLQRADTIPDRAVMFSEMEGRAVVQSSDDEDVW